MTRTEFENKTFEEIIEILYEERDDITTYETLKEFAKEQIDNNIFLAIHILEALRDDESEWYEYDYSMGTLQIPSGLNCIEHIEHLIDD